MDRDLLPVDVIGGAGWYCIEPNWWAGGLVGLVSWICLNVFSDSA